MTYFKELIEISKKNYFEINYLQSIKNNIINGHIYVLRSAFNTHDLKKIFYEKINIKVKPSTSVKMIEGVEDIFYKSDSSGTGAYTTNDYSWYFFPWNEDKSGLTKLMQPFFDQVILLNNYDPKKIIKNTPKDEIIQRMQLIYYPLGSGHISLHRDPVNITEITCGVYITSFGEDYDEGGFYVYNQHKEKIYIDHKIKSGDLILFYNGLFHGVDRVLKKNSKENSSSKYDGRCFLNLSLLQSHEVNNRQTTVGISELN